MGLTSPSSEDNIVLKPARNTWTDGTENNQPWALDTNNKYNQSLDLKHATHIATWNVHILLKPGSASLLCLELERYNTALAVLCEVR